MVQNFEKKNTKEFKNMVRASKKYERVTDSKKAGMIEIQQLFWGDL